jgi:hypothetical protein
VSFRAEVCENGVAADFLVERADGTRLGCGAAWIVVSFDGGGLAAMAAGTGVEVVALGEVEGRLLAKGA